MPKRDPANLYRWQLRAHEALGVLIAHGVGNDFPPLTWTLASTGALTGEAVGLTATPAEQRAAVEVWAGYLRATVKERVKGDGTVELNAHFKWSDSDYDGGAIRATIFPPLDDEGGE